MERAEAFSKKKFSSKLALKRNWFAMKTLGLDPPEIFSLSYWIYSAIINLTVTVYYPLSVIIYIVVLPDKKTLVASLTVTLRIIVCCLKGVNNFLKRKELHKANEQLDRLDATVDMEKDGKYMQHIVRTASYIFRLYFVVYGAVSATSELPVLFADERRLLYEAWFPVDWKNSKMAYVLANAYQYIGLNVLIFSNMMTDSFPGTLMRLLKGHLHVIGERVKRIGYDPNVSGEENYKQLVGCIQDHKICLGLYVLCQNVISRVMILQFISTEVSLCATAVYILFIGDDLFQILPLAIYFVSMAFEISASCYCGSELQEESIHFTTALYSCNWMEQDLKFRKVLIIFMQQTQKSWTIWAGGIVSVSLATYANVLKSTYSLFAVLSQLT